MVKRGDLDIQEYLTTDHPFMKRVIAVYQRSPTDSASMLAKSLSDDLSRNGKQGYKEVFGPECTALPEAFKKERNNNNKTLKVESVFQAVKDLVAFSDSHGDTIRYEIIFAEKKKSSISHDATKTLAISLYESKLIKDGIPPYPKDKRLVSAILAGGDPEGAAKGDGKGGCPGTGGDNSTSHVEELKAAKKRADDMAEAMIAMKTTHAEEIKATKKRADEAMEAMKTSHVEELKAAKKRIKKLATKLEGYAKFVEVTTEESRQSLGKFECLKKDIADSDEDE